MAFVNEYIHEADFERFELRRVCGEHNVANPGRMYRKDWTIDRERDAFLIQTWFRHDAEFSGWAFYCTGGWIFFELRMDGGGGPQPDGSCWYRYLIKDFQIPDQLRERRSQVVAELTEALGVYRGGGVFSSYAHGTANLEFVGEE